MNERLLVWSYNINLIRILNGDTLFFFLHEFGIIQIKVKTQNYYSICKALFDSLLVSHFE